MIFLFSPFLILFLSLPFEVSFSRVLDFGSSWNALKNSFWLACGASVCSLSLGVLGSLGLLSKMGKPSLKIHSFVYLLPNLMPHLLIVIAAINAIEIFTEFPYGFVGIFIIETMMLSGVVSLSFFNSIKDKMGDILILPIIEGASFSQVFFKGVLGYLKRDLLQLFLFVFSITFTSFSVPFLVGKNLLTLEVLIYELIRVKNEWTHALLLTGVEILFLLLLGLLLKKPKAEHRPSNKYLSSMGKKYGLWPSWMLLLFLVLGLFRNFGSGIKKLLEDRLFLAYLLDGLRGSFLIGFSTGVLTLFFLAVLLFIQPGRFLKKLLQGYVAPSSILTGFALLLVPRMWLLVDWVKISLGLSLISVPILYRLYFATHFDSLFDQVQVARTLGASKSQVFWKITGPQFLNSFGFMAGLASFWAVGDFALSGVIATRDFTLALIIKNLIATYRLDMATVVVWVLLLCGALCLFVFKGLSYVFSKKY
ncbi:MAG: hypothetical protein KDD50_11670 [Bdellovibrionales bacterium]|nr:hypothetical protein [Bdellovibrionales bacterium]